MAVSDDFVLGGEPTAEAPRPHRLGVVVAVLLPPLALVAGWLIGKLGAWPRAVVPGGSTWLPLSAIWLLAVPVALFCSFTLAFAAAGKSVPASLPVLFAGGPWLIGVALAAVAQIDVAHAMTVAGGGVGAAAAGLAEATLMRLAGELPSAALLCAVGVALAVAALCQPDDGRKSERGSLVGTLMALPAVGFTVIEWAGRDVVMPMSLMAATALALTSALAGGGAGNAPPRLRSAALAAAAPVASGLGFLAAAHAHRDRVLVEELQAAALTGKALSAVANARIAEAARYAAIAGSLALIPIVAMTTWAYVRTRPHAPRWAGALVLAVIAIFVAAPALLLGPPRAMLELLAKAPQQTARELPSTALSGPATRRGPPDGKMEGAWAPAPSSGDGAPVDARRIGGDVRPPRALVRVQPVYPEEARLARTQGEVIVDAVIDEQGGVSRVRVLKGLPNGLDDAAVEAVKQWKFAPATLYGKPVAVYFTLTVNFKLDSRPWPF